MKFKTFKNIEKKVKKTSFANSYFELDIILYGLSFFGNVASVFLASFFFTKLFSESFTDINNPIVIWGATLFLLIGLELLKRNLFNKFSTEFLRTKTVFKTETAILSFFSIMIISMSFYASLRGAREFTSLNDKISSQATERVSNYKDSVSKIYNDKILVIEKQNIVLFDKTQQYDNRIDKVDVLMSNATKTREKNALRKELQNIRKDKEINTSLIEKNEAKIKELKVELSANVETTKNEVVSNADSEIEKNKSNSITFVIISTIIELLILVGIYFNKTYQFVSYNSMRELIITKEPYKRWLLYNELLDLVYLNKATVSSTILSETEFFEMMQISHINIDKSEYDMFIKLLNQLKVLRRQNIINMNRNKAEAKIREYFKIV